MDRPVRYGVIGAGRMGGMSMLNLMPGHPAAVPVAFFDINPDRSDTAERIAQLRQRGVEQCESLEQLLSRDDLDIIYNCTPHFAHAQTTIAALQAGWDVLCEKPPATDLDQCRAMAAAASAAGKKLMIHFQHRLRPSARWLGEAIRRGDLGRIRRIACLSLWWRSSEYYTRVEWAGKRMFKGQPTFDGTLTNQTVHYLNQMLALAQRTGESHVARAADLRAALYRFHPGEFLEMEDTAVVVGQLDNEDQTQFAFAGTTCAAEAAGANPQAEYGGELESHRITIEGERGRAVWDGKTVLEVDGRETQIFDQPDGAWPFYFHVRNVLAGREQPVTPADQCLHTVEFIHQALAAGGKTHQRHLDQCHDVSAVLKQCTQDFALPAELPNPPTWA